MRPWCLSLFALALLAGCPRDAQEPRRGSAAACARYPDCNEGATCADVPLKACVDKLCEHSPTLVVPCLRSLTAPIDAAAP